MSRASEYAAEIKRLLEIDVPRFKGPNYSLYLDDNGDLCMTDGEMEAKDIPAFIEWLKATFL